MKLLPPHSLTACLPLHADPQDAHEFLTVLLDQLQEECSVTEGSGARAPHPEGPVKLTFDCEIEHVRTCATCGEVSDPNRELFRDFSLDVEWSTGQAPSVQRLLERFFEVSWRCPPPCLPGVCFLVIGPI